MERKLTCIICPLGCELTATIDNGLINVTGYTCPRGKTYAENECTNPLRTVTSTVRCKNGGLVAVKTENSIPKEKITECMQLINNAIANTPVSVGDVIIDNVFGTRIIATQNKE